MRVAVCLSGQPRQLDKCIDTLLRDVIVPNNADVFYHTWWDESLDGTPFDSAQPHQIGSVGKWDSTNIKILETLNAKNSIIQKPMNFIVSGLRSSPTANQNSMCSVFYSQWRSGLLKSKYENDNNFKYDVVIRARLDIVYNGVIDINNIGIKSSTLVLANKWQDIRQSLIPGLGDYTMDDNFAIGDSATMDTYLSVYPNMANLNAKIHVPFAENYLGWHCKKDNNIQVETHNFLIEISHRIK